MFLSHSRTDIRLSEHLMALCFSWPGSLCGCSMSSPANGEASVILGRASGCHTYSLAAVLEHLVVSSLARCLSSGKPGRVLEFLAEEVGESFGKPFLPTSRHWLLPPPPLRAFMFQRRHEACRAPLPLLIGDLICLLLVSQSDAVLPWQQT